MRHIDDRSRQSIIAPTMLEIRAQAWQDRHPVPTPHPTRDDMNKAVPIAQEVRHMRQSSRRENKAG
jgi:hypothetical protein